MSIKSKIIDIASSCPRILSLYNRIASVLSGTSGKLFSHRISYSARVLKSKLSNYGSGNNIVIGDLSRLDNCSFQFYGSNNTILIGSNCRLMSVDFWIEDDNNVIEIGDNSSLCGSAQLACIEGRRISIGEGCLFSSGIHFRTGDSHSVTNLEGRRINAPKDIVIGNHVWIGQNAFIGKGACVARNSIIGAYSMLTKQFHEENVIIAGNPAKAVKRNVSWTLERLPIDPTAAE